MLFRSRSGIFNIEGLTQTESLESKLRISQLIFLLTNSDDFKNIEETVNNQVETNAIIVDFWGSLNGAKLRKDIRYFCWGKN